MKKIWYFTVTFLALLLVLVLLPGSPVYKPLISHVRKEAEKTWGCKIATKQSRVNLFKGTLTLNEVTAQTPGSANPSWDLSLKTSVIQIDYRSFLRREWILALLLLDNIRFKQLEKENPRPTLPKENAGKKSKVPDVKAGTEKKTGSKRVKQIHIRQLTVQNGYFEFGFVHTSGRKDMFRVQNVNLNSENLFFEGKPDRFFKSVLVPNDSLNF